MFPAALFGSFPKILKDRDDKALIFGKIIKNFMSPIDKHSARLVQ